MAEAGGRETHKGKAVLARRGRDVGAGDTRPRLFVHSRRVHAARGGQRLEGQLSVRPHLIDGLVVLLLGGFPR